MDYRYQGILLAKYDIAEVDRIYLVYTLEAGKIRVVGKGVRNANAKLAGHLEPITFVQIGIAKARGMGKITSVVMEENFSAIKSDFSSLERVFFVFRILDKMITEQEGDRRIFDLLCQYLSAMEKLSEAGKKEEKMDVLNCSFVFKLLQLSGYKLEMENCANCAKKLLPGNNYFSIPAGGIICSNCQSMTVRKIAITDGAVKFIRIILNNNISNVAKLEVSRKDIENIKRVVNESVRWIVS